MDKDSPQKKKPLFQGLLKRGHPGHSLSDQSRNNVTNENQSSSGHHMFGGNVFRNIFKSTHSRGARQAPHPPPTIPNLSASDHPTQDPPPHTYLDADPNCVQRIKFSGAKVETPDPIQQRIGDADETVAGMKTFSGTVQKTPSVIDDLQSGLDKVDTVSSLLEPLRIFNSVATEVANIHPYAKIVLSVFTCASKMILDQEDRDNAVQSLLEKISDVYKFMNEGRLNEIPTMQELYGRVARQTLECADFIVHYSETKSVWKRLVKNVFKETKAGIQNYSDALDALMQQFRDNAARGTILKVYRIAEDLDLKDMVCVNDAGRDSSKRCLPGTRKCTLSEIETWIDSTREDVERVFWLSGTAGKGKSAIAHTVARWFLERGGAGAFFGFDRTCEAERWHKRIFATIARDLADHDPIIWRALASAVREDNELRHTTDIMKQWKEFILGPVEAALKVVVSPVLIVIDALDESGDIDSRKMILRALAGHLDAFSDSSELTQLPRNIRILVTSRPLDDIHQSLHDVSHVRHASMDDEAYIPAESSKNDIQQYVSTRLEHLQVFNEAHFKKLAAKSDGLFEWARLACEYIKGTNKPGMNPNKRFEAVVGGIFTTGTRLLDKMYRDILEDIMSEDVREDIIPVFHSVMGQILVSLEPLSITALNAMRHYFPHDDDRYDVDETIRSLGSLVTRSADSPVRPLHASFYDFLTDKSRSKTFFVDKLLAQRNLAFASLGVMKHDLRFNICSLENSYLPNSAVAGLEKRVESAISAQMSYSCRWWGSHVGATSVESLLAEEVRAFFDGDRLLFWLEALALLKTLSGSVATLACIAKWLTGFAEYTDIADAVGDTIRFVRTFAPAISHSTPHLYLSALSLAPRHSMIYKKFIAKFPRSLRAVGGHIEHWPAMEKIIHVDPCLSTMAISSDGRRIVCRWQETTIHILDIVTGELLGAPLPGDISLVISQNGDRIVSLKGGTVSVRDVHTGKILGTPFKEYHIQTSPVTISSDGTRIAWSSWDSWHKTIEVWDTGAGKALYAPLEGHSDLVKCIAISLDGHRIISCGYNEIRVWDMKTGGALGVADFEDHIDLASSFEISPDGNRIALFSYVKFERKIRLWDTNTGKLLCLFRHDVNAFTFLPDGNSFVTGSRDGLIQLWDARTGEALGMPLRGHTSAVTFVVVSPDGNRIVSFSRDNTIRVWDAGACNAPDHPPRGHTDGIFSIAISPDGKRILSDSNDQTIRVWDRVTGEALCAPLAGHMWDYSSVATNGHLIVSGSSDRTIRVWDPMTHKAIGAPLEHPGFFYIVHVTISLDGTRIIISGPNFGMMAYMWDDVTGWKSGELFRACSRNITSLAISLDGNFIVSGSNFDTIQVWDIMTREELDAPLRHPEVRCIAISPDTKFIVSGSYSGEIRVWNRVTRGTLVKSLNGHTDGVTSIAISLDSNLIVSSSWDKTIRVWNAMTGEALGAPLRGHTSDVNSIAISPDGKRIISCSRDKTIRVWDLEFPTQPLKHPPYTSHLVPPMPFALPPPFCKILTPPFPSFRPRMDGL